MKATDMIELRPVLDAFRRGTKRSRLRLLVVVCPAGHTLLEVFPTTAGATALWEGRDRWVMDASGEIVKNDSRHTEWRAEVVPEQIEFDGDVVGGVCRCQEARQVRLSFLRAALDRQDRRVVAAD